MFQFDSLPIEIWLSIINLLPVKDVVSMERTSKRVHQLVQPAIKQKCTRLLQSPKYHSRQRIKENLNLVIKLAKRNILPSIHQQLWALEAALHSKPVEAIDTIKAHYSLIPPMHNICIAKIQVANDKDIERMAAEFMQFLDSKGITHQHLDIKGKTVEEIIDMWAPIDRESSNEFTDLAQIGDFEGCQRLLSRGRIRIYLASYLESETISLKMLQFLVEQPGINVNEGGHNVPLVEASLSGNIDRVKFLLEQPGIDVNQLGIRDTALIDACRKGRIEIVKLLLEQPEIDVNIPEVCGATAIMCAILNGRQDIVKLLASHPDINLNYSRKRDKKTLLIFACELNDVEIVDWLLGIPAININMTDHCNRTALHHAAVNGHLKIVERLLQHPAINVNQAEKDGNTAMMLAASKGHCNIIKLLLRHSSMNFDAVVLCKSANLNAVGFLMKRPEFDFERFLNDSALVIQVLTLATSAGHIDTIKMLFKHIPIGMQGIDKVYGRALLGACSHGHLNVAKMLLNHPDMNILLAKNDNETTALMIACKANSVDIVELLLKYPQLDVNQADKDGNTALIHACKNGCVDIVKLLLSQPGIDVNLFNGRGETALIVAQNYATRYGRTALTAACYSVNKLDLMRLLLKYPGIDVNHADENGDTALILAARRASVQLVECLLADPGIRINHRNKQGNTALMIAIECGPVNMVEMLLQRPRINLHQSNTMGDTALILAAERPECLHILEFLLAERKVNVNHKNIKGDTALTIAMKYCCWKSVHILMKHPKIDVNRSNSNGHTP